MPNTFDYDKWEITAAAVQIYLYVYYYLQDVYPKICSPVPTVSPQKNMFGSP